MKRNGINRPRSWVLALCVLILLGCASFGQAEDLKYNKCLRMTIEDPSNIHTKVGTENTKQIVMDSGMYYFEAGDQFTLTVKNKCKVTGKLYVKAHVYDGDNTTIYYHKIDTSGGMFPQTVLDKNKVSYSDAFNEGEVVLWAFLVSDLNLGPVVFEAYLQDESSTTIGFDSKTVYFHSDTSQELTP